MAPASAISTRNAARNAIVEADVHAITGLEYSGENARKFKLSILTVAKNVSSKAGGAEGVHGHAYLAKTDTEFNVRAGANPSVAGNPGLLVFTTALLPKINPLPWPKNEKSTRLRSKCSTPKKASRVDFARPSSITHQKNSSLNWKTKTPVLMKWTQGI